MTLTIKKPLTPLTEYFAQSQTDRAIFVANNPGINPAAAQALEIGSRDMLVQFNRCIAHRFFRDIACHKVHVFNCGGEQNWWGIAPDGKPETDYLDQRYESLSYVFVNWMSDAIKAHVAEQAERLLAGVMNVRLQVPSFVYPDSPAKVMQPSVGFATLCYFRYVNLLRYLAGAPQMKLVLVGFTGQYPPRQAWEGHDFAYEQQVYATWLDLIRLDANGAPIAQG